MITRNIIKDRMALLLQGLLLFLTAGLLTVSCVYDFTPTGIENDVDILVIEGDIIAGDNSYFKISTTIPLTTTDTIKYITKATVWVESESGEIINAVYDSNTAGTFRANTVGLDLNKKYKLRVDIPGKGAYQSSYVPILQTPPIDSITYSINNNRTYVQLSVTTHNNNPDNKYYKWNYKEDWEFRAEHIPLIRYNKEKDIAEPIPYDELGNNYTCWQRDSSSGIFVATAEKLAQNIIYKQPLNAIYSSDRKISYIYSILVSQISLTQQAYIYWETLKKNTEETGGIFAPQPSEMRGNLESITHPGEPVLGYISASTQTTQRIFIYNDKLNIYKNPVKCQLDTLAHFESKANLWKDAAQGGSNEMLFYEEESNIKVIWTTGFCANCLKMGGTKRKPKFWPNDH